MGMAFIASDQEILIGIAVNRAWFSRQNKARQRLRLARQLQPRLIHMVGIKMAITARPDELPHFQSRLLRQHMSEQRIGRNVERHAEKHICTTLIKLQRQLPIADPCLKQTVARGESHPVHFARVPSRHYLAARRGVGFKSVNQRFDLIDAAAVGSFPMTPLLTVNRPKIAIVVRPIIPDADLIFGEPFGIRVAVQKPQQFIDDGAQMQFLRRDQRKTMCQVETHLVAKDRPGANAGAVLLFNPVVKDVLHQIKVSAHGTPVTPSPNHAIPVRKRNGEE